MASQETAKSPESGVKSEHPLFGPYPPRRENKSVAADSNPASVVPDAAKISKQKVESEAVRVGAVLSKGWPANFWIHNELQYHPWHYAALRFLKSADDLGLDILSSAPAGYRLVYSNSKGELVKKRWILESDGPKLMAALGSAFFLKKCEQTWYLGPEALNADRRFVSFSFDFDELLAGPPKRKDEGRAAVVPKANITKSQRKKEKSEWRKKIVARCEQVASEVSGLVQDEVARNVAPAIWIEGVAKKCEPSNIGPKDILGILSAYLPSWRGERFLPYGTKTKPEPCYIVDGLLVVLGVDFCRSLILGDMEAIHKALEDRLAEARLELANRLAPWQASKPAWFPEELLNDWAVRSGIGRSGAGMVHPAMALFDCLRPAAGSTLGKCRLELSYQGLANIEHEIDALGACEALWRQKRFAKKSDGNEALMEKFSAWAQTRWGPELEARVEALSEELRPAVASAMAESRVADDEGELDAALLYWAALGLAHAGANPERALRRAQSEALAWVAEKNDEREMRDVADRLPRRLVDFYPKARSMGRRLTLVTGPTNSGKTHRALEILRQARSGVYLGPLRLLALEVYERLNAAGTPTNLVTGEQVEQRAGAMHDSATIEMADMGRQVDVAVVDEAQMLADPQRGSAWLRAILGAPAKHVVILGSPECVEAVRMLAAQTGEPLAEETMERLCGLEFDTEPTAVEAAPPGTALIVFSRREALNLANHMRRAGKSVAIVYGALSPAARSEQARLFREGEAEVIVATDAIGMGLNLPISKVLFTTDSKWNGSEDEMLSPALAKQISGRAGRFGMGMAGTVGATGRRALASIRSLAMSAGEPIPSSFHWGLSSEVADAIAGAVGSERLFTVADVFVSRFAFEEWAVPVFTDDQFLLAQEVLDDAGLPLAEKLWLSNAPAVDKSVVNSWFPLMVESLAEGTAMAFPPLDERFDDEGLEGLERALRDLTLYCWMANRRPEAFPEIERAKSALGAVNKAIGRALAKSQGRDCSQCGEALAWDFPHGRCEDCFSSGRGRWNSYAYTEYAEEFDDEDDDEWLDDEE